MSERPGTDPLPGGSAGGASPLGDHVGRERSCRVQGRRLAAAVGSAGQVAALAIAPVAVFLGLRVRSMAEVNMIDPYLHTAYIEHGRDLMHRFGTTGFTASYQWVRVGLIVPAHVFFGLFGAVPGFYAFRYVLALLAIAPAYLLFRRLHGPAAGWLAVLVVLTCPVILTAWGSDYPDSAAVSYLLAGTACLVMPAAPARRWLWVLAAGGLFALAVHSHVVAGLAAGSAVLAYLTVFWRRSILASLLDVLLLGTAAAAITGILILASYRYYGQWSIFEPTIQALTFYRQPSEMAKFHSTTWKWLLHDVYLLVPPAVIAAWLAVAWRRHERLPREEAAVALALTLTLVAYTLAEFAAGNWTLEYSLYSSLLFGGAMLVLAAALVRVSGPLLRTGAWAFVPVGLVIAVPALLRPLRPAIQFELPVAIPVALAVIAAALAARARFSGVPIRRVPAVAVVLVAVTTLTTGLPLQHRFFPGQAVLLVPDYGSVLFSDGGSALDDYAVSSELSTVVPSSLYVPGTMLMWWPQHHHPVVDEAAAHYLWYDDAIGDTLPALDDAQARFLLVKDTRWLVLLSDDGREFGPAMEQLRERGFAPMTWREQVLASGSVSMRVRVVELTEHPVSVSSAR